MIEIQLILAIRLHGKQQRDDAGFAIGRKLFPGCRLAGVVR